MDSEKWRRIFIRLGLTFSLVLFTGMLTSCGGGGGDGTPTAGTNTGGTPTTGTDTGTDVEAPEANIFSPPLVSTTDDASVLVIGTARDETGISFIRLNDLTVTPTAKTEEGLVFWEIDMPLSLGDNTLILSTRDTLGNTNTNADSIKIKRRLVFFSPNGVAVDAANNRALVTDGSLKALIAVDLTTGNRIILSDATTGSG